LDDRGHENNGEERCDVEDQQLLLEGPGEGEQEKDADAEEDVSANGYTGFFVTAIEGDGWGGQLVLLWVHTVRCR
jgi:hypothetical protein